MEDLKRKVAEMIVRRCNLSREDLENCDYDAPLFYHEDDENSIGGFELDSVDSLEIVAGVKEDFGIIMKTNDKNVFYNISTIARYIEENRVQ